MKRGLLNLANTKTIRLSVILASLLVGCGGGGGDQSNNSDQDGEEEINETVTEVTPTPTPIEQPPVQEMELDREGLKIALGKNLFWDPVLSGDQSVACASCHHPDLSYADGRQVSIGLGGKGLGPLRVDETGGAFVEDGVPVRNAPTVLNSAFTGNLTTTLAGDGLGDGPMFWDSRIFGLDQQALEPIKNFSEMRGNHYTEEEAVPVVLARLNGIPAYVSAFQAAFNHQTEITADQLGDAIAAFEISLTALDSRFDRYQAGDTSVMNEQELRGMDKFTDLRCVDCHLGTLQSDSLLHRLGVADVDGQPVDDGDGDFQFRTPSLRNVEFTAPYMHNGSMQTLEEVMEFYDNRRSENPNVTQIDRLFAQLRPLRPNDRADLIAFLKTLSSEFDRSIPESVPSGGPVGGNIQ